MISPEIIQDITSLNLKYFYGIGNSDIPNKHLKLFEEYGVEKNQELISALISNIDNCYLNKEELEHKYSKLRIKLFKDIKILEIIHNLASCDFVNFIKTIPMFNPVSILFCENNDTQTISSKTYTIDNVNSSIEYIYQQFVKHLDETVTVNQEDLSSLIKNFNCDKVIYNKSLLVDKNSFQPMISNARIIETLESPEVEKMHYEHIEFDEMIIKKKGNSTFDHCGFVFMPYIFLFEPVKYINNENLMLSQKTLMRFGTFISNVKHYYKKIKIKI